MYTDYREMFGSPNLDAVIIASPDDLHYPMTMAALQAGLHVLCEKPMALNAKDAREMLETAERAGVKHMIMFTWRWFPHYQYMQKLLADGFVGRSYHAHMRFLSNQARTNEYRWLFDPQHSIGALGAIGSHMIDMARFLFGDITRVSAHLGTYMERIGLDEKPYQGANESALLALEYANGTQGMIHVSQVAHTADRWREQYVSVHGDLGSLESDWKVGGAEAAVTLRGARHNEEQFQARPVPEDYLNGVELGTIFPVFEKHLVGPRLFIDAIVMTICRRQTFVMALKYSKLWTLRLSPTTAAAGLTLVHKSTTKDSQ